MSLESNNLTTNPWTYFHNYRSSYYKLNTNWILKKHSSIIYYNTGEIYPQKNTANISTREAETVFIRCQVEKKNESAMDEAMDERWLAGERISRAIVAAIGGVT